MTCDSLHEFILETIKEDLISLVLSHKKIKHQAWNDRELFSMLFKNYRTSNTGHKGLRLTYVGDRSCAKHFASYAYKVSKHVSNKDLLELDKKMIWPYYVGKEHISFYSQDDAAWFQLNGNDLTEYTNHI
jgi:hypothetical protein